MTSSATERTFDAAVEVLKGNSTPRGLKASSSYYNQVWARDSFISFLGSNMLGDETLLSCARATVDTFARSRSPLGQIANFYDPANGRADFGFSGSTDSAPWYIIGLADLYRATDDRSLLKEPLDAAVDAYRWLRYQDSNNSWLVDSPQGADWMDAAIQRTGKTVYNNALLLMATRCIGDLCSVAGRRLNDGSKLDYTALLERFNDVFLPDEESPKRVSGFSPRLAEQLSSQRPVGLSQEYYVQYVSFARIDTHFDTLSNLLCILFGLAESKTSRSIMEAIRSRELSKPYPVRVLDPPYSAGEPGFDTRLDATLPEQHRSPPFAYHNGGIWPFVGGLYVWALNKLGSEEAPTGLDRLAAANMVRGEGDGLGFNEWLHGRSGRPLGQRAQSWNAGAYIAAYLSIEKGDRLSVIR
ncbi:MAG: hypothetical protein LYZ69_00985 [Nitrososphaerales archaeon]|nr:hypothetical protein [Nitrososphaerales archaeon]